MTTSEFGLTPEDRFNRIAECGLCIGCGLCQSLAEEARIRMALTDGGYERPVVTGDLNDSLVDDIYATCPGTRIEGLPEAQRSADTPVDPVWGPHRSIVRAWAADPDIRFRGSTGGVLTALALYLLETARVTLVFHARPSQRYPAVGP